MGMQSTTFSRAALLDDLASSGKPIPEFLRPAWYRVGRAALFGIFDLVTFHIVYRTVGYSRRATAFFYAQGIAASLMGSLLWTLAEGTKEGAPIPVWENIAGGVVIALAVAFIAYCNQEALASLGLPTNVHRRYHIGFTVASVVWGALSSTLLSLAIFLVRYRLGKKRFELGATLDDSNIDRAFHC